MEQQPNNAVSKTKDRAMTNSLASAHCDHEHVVKTVAVVLPLPLQVDEDRLHVRVIKERFNVVRVPARMLRVPRQRELAHAAVHHDLWTWPTVAYARGLERRLRDMRPLPLVAAHFLGNNIQINNDEPPQRSMPRYGCANSYYKDGTERAESETCMLL